MTREVTNYCLKIASNFGLTHGYTTLSQTVSGTSGTHTLTANSTLATTSCVTGSVIRIDTADDEYTIASVAGAVITTIEALSTDYTAATLKVDVVSAWVGSEGFGSSAAQGTAANRPAYIPNGAANGQAAIVYPMGAKAMVLANNVHTDNFFVGGGTLWGVINAVTAGASNLGRVIERETSGGAAAWNIQTIAGGGGFLGLQFNQITSGTTGSFRTNAVVEQNAPQIFNIYYNSSTPTIPPIFRVQGVTVATVTVTPPTGTAISDTGGTYTIGNRPAGDRGFNGAINMFYMYKRLLTVYESQCLERFLSNMWGAPLFGSTFLGTGRLFYGNRTFDYSTPDAPASVPMLLCLHGGGGDGPTFEIQLQLGALFRQEAILVFPTGTPDQYGSPTWNSGGFQTFNYAPDTIYLPGLVDWVTKNVALTGFTVTEVYIVGHSNGGMMAYRLVIDHPTKFAGIFAISADVMVTNPDVYSGRIQQWHGQDDANVPLAGGVGIGGRTYPPVIETVQQFTHVNHGRGVVVGSSDPLVIADFNITPSPAAHSIHSQALVLQDPPYETTFAQLIYNFVFPS